MASILDKICAQVSEDQQTTFNMIYFLNLNIGINQLINK
jgi:hypothetical protein